jgi:hypothetical protein
MAFMSADQNTSGSGVWLETMNWLEAEAVLKEADVVVIPLGAAAKQHGPHLPLRSVAPPQGGEGAKTFKQVLPRSFSQCNPAKPDQAQHQSPVAGIFAAIASPC